MSLRLKPLELVTLLLASAGMYYGVIAAQWWLVMVLVAVALATIAFVVSRLRNA